MKIVYDGQLITTALVVTFRGKSIKINNVIIDTGSSHTIISPDIIEEIGGSVPFYTKVLDEIQIDRFSIKDFEIDVGVLPKEHSGLLGLDILKQYHFIIDLENLELLSSNRGTGN